MIDTIFGILVFVVIVTNIYQIKNYKTINSDTLFGIVSNDIIVFTLFISKYYFNNFYITLLFLIFLIISSKTYKKDSNIKVLKKLLTIEMIISMVMISIKLFLFFV